LAKEETGKIVSKVIDLGAAKEVEPSGEATATGMTIGSPHYMSVEQASGAKDIDARTDQFSLAVVLYQMLTGARPYENDDSGHALAKLLAGAPFAKPRAIVPSISAMTESAILRGLSREREQRFATLAQFLDALPNDVAPLSGDATRFEPIEERADRAKKAAIASAPRGPSQPTTVNEKEEPKTSIGLIAAFGIAVILVLGLGYAKFFPTPHDPISPPSPDSASVASVATPLQRDAPPPVQLGLQGSTPNELATSPPTTTTASAAPTASHKSISPSAPHHVPAAPKASASAVPCTPTPGAPCL
jgi:serine/threonine-protein kinase